MKITKIFKIQRTIIFQLNNQALVEIYTTSVWMMVRNVGHKVNQKNGSVNFWLLLDTISIKTLEKNWTFYNVQNWNNELIKLNFNLISDCLFFSKWTWKKRSIIYSYWNSKSLLAEHVRSQKLFTASLTPRLNFLFFCSKFCLILTFGRCLHLFFDQKILIHAITILVILFL